MNLLLFEPEDLENLSACRLAQDRQTHIREVLGCKPGQRIRIGKISGNRGTARVCRADNGTWYLDDPQLTEPGGSFLDADLVLALPRPKMARRVMESAVQIGFRSIHLINSWKVDKSYWQSRYLQPSNLRRTLLRGAEQAAVTCIPEVTLHPLFKPFVEDQLPQMLDGRIGLVADPYAQSPCPVSLVKPSLLVIGPEGGFTSYEIDRLSAAGVQSVSLGDRIFRVETALPLLGGRLYTSQSK